MKISLIAAMSRNRVIGKNNDLPWHLPDDFRFFKNKTQGHHVIMGRKNFESLPHTFRPLPDRTNLIVTRQTDFRVDGAFIFHDIHEAMAFAESRGEDECFIIGGGEIYRLALPFADIIYLTEIDAEIEGDVTFPSIPKNWSEMERLHHPIDEKHRYGFDFVTYTKE